MLKSLRIRGASYFFAALVLNVGCAEAATNPTFSKTFGKAGVPLGQQTTLNFTINNLDTVFSLGGIMFSDTLPAGLSVSNPSVITGACPGGTITAVANSNVISLSGASLSPSTSCTFAVEVTGMAAGTWVNQTGTLTATGSDSSSVSAGPAMATIDVIAPPVLTKQFGAVKFALNGGGTGLTYTITNPSANTEILTGVSITDSFPPGLIIATPNGFTNNCGGTLNAVAGSNLVVLSNATVAIGGSCTLMLNVAGTPPGGTVQNSATINSSNGGAGTTAHAMVTIVNPPILTKAFNPTVIAIGASSKLTLTITNPNPDAIASLSGVGFTDPLPSGLIISSTPNLLASCLPNTPPTTLGTVTANAGASTITVSGATLAANTTCTISLNVTGIAAGLQTNSTSIVTSPDSGNTAGATTSLYVLAPPKITKVFNPVQIPVSGAGDLSTLTFTITNPNILASGGGSLSSISFNDTLPAGVIVAAPPSITGSCPLGSVTAVAGSSSISAAGFSLVANVAGNSSCTISVNVTGTTAGLKTNSITASDTIAGAGNTSTATLLVVGPPVLTKAFVPNGIPFNVPSPVTFTITNPNTVALTGIGFMDNLPSSLTASPSTSTVCGGTLTVTTASITLTGATLAAGVGTFCTFTVNVTAGTPGITITNTTTVITSTEGGPGLPATATTTSLLPPFLTKAFTPSTSIPLGSNATLSFTITNPSVNPFALTGVSVSDTLAPGLVVASPNGLSGSCGGTVTAVAGSGVVSLTGGTIAVASSCTFSVSVTGTTTGIKNNQATPSSTNGGPGTPSTPVSILVIGPPTITKAFGALSVGLNGTTTLQFTIMNPNSAAGSGLSGIAFLDLLPSGLIVATPNGLTGNTCTGVVGAAAGSNNVSLLGATLAPGASCTFFVNVTGIASGVQNNSTGPITSNEGGTGTPGTATIVVLLPPVISKSFSPSSVAVNGTTTLTFTIQNPGANPASLTGVAFADSLPAGLVVSTPNGETGTCGGTVTAVAGSGSISLSGGTLAAGTSCNISVNVIDLTPGSKVNVVTVTSTNAGPGNTATATLTVTSGLNGPPTITKSFSSPTVTPGGAAVILTFVITNPSSNTLNGVGFTDTLPAPLVGSATLTNTCGGSVSFTLATETIALTGGTLPPGASCTVTDSITVPLIAAAGRVCNTSSVVSPGGLFAAIACISVGPLVEPSDSYQIDYAANLNIGDSFVNITNGGNLAGPVGATPANLGNLCANVYVFDPREELIACCTCLVTPNGLNSLSAVNDLIKNPLTPNIPTSITIDLVGSAPVAGICNAGSPSNVNLQTLLGGLNAWGTTLEPTAPGTGFGVVPTKFLRGVLSISELNALVTTCNFIQTNGSNFGICGACATGALPQL